MYTEYVSVLAELIEEARTGSQTAASKLFRVCWPIAWNAAFRITQQRALAEDAAQTAVQNVFRSLATFDETRPIEPWVRRIAVNASLNALRTESKTSPVDTSELDVSSPLTVAEGSPESGAVIAAVAALPLEQRLVVALHYWLDYSAAEIAELLELPVGTVASRVSRALKALRTELEEEHVS